ncbi:DsbA family protein [Maritalea mediterranea]|uniref:DsbA family protein n=1 Tax=Maritalea mediterranea TaxID=2909667 RepID=A0ABS9EAC9_9HYPH|nr:DsbA family protein [Maritalea mediterranea]MCF4099844.1 DsbA family protein [Maritalea mediterranea]
MRFINTLIRPLAAAALALSMLVPAQAQSVGDMSKDELSALIEQIVEEKIENLLADTPKASAAKGRFGMAVEDYLLANPQLLERMSVALQTQAQEAEIAQTRETLKALGDRVYNDPDQVVLGNPNGDVTVVEFFDYNCGYCRQAVGNMMQLLETDKNVRFILREFPILSQGSADAARISTIVNRTEGVDYLEFHTKLFQSRGQVDKARALEVATEMGMNPVELELAMQDQSITQAIGRTYQLADALGINSTPNYIIGNEVVRGAESYEGLKRRVDNLRECGETTCP